VQSLGQVTLERVLIKNVSCINYEQAITETSTRYAPWYIVPANRKWYRDLVISTLLVRALENLKNEISPATGKPG
jgi:Uncharacterized conserved protein